MAKIEPGMTVVAKSNALDITNGRIYTVFAGEKDELYLIDNVGERSYIDADDDEFEPISGELPNMVESPPHYQNARFETIEVIEEITAGYSDGFVAYALGNSIKYIARAPYKHGDNGLEDLRKSVRYLQYAIERIEKMNQAK